MNLRKSLQRKFTLVLIPGAPHESRQWRLNAKFLYGSLIVVAVLGVGMVSMMVAYFSQSSSVVEQNLLRSENLELTQKYERLRWELADVNANYDELVAKEIAIREMFDLPEIDSEQRLLGVGGPGGIPPRIDSPVDAIAYHSEADLDRLNRLARFELEKFGEVVEALSGKKRRLDNTPSIRPCRGWMSRGIGMKPNPFTGSMQYHAGIDLANRRGTPVVATANGKITRAKRKGGMGNLIVIDHGFGLVTRYGHLDKILVKRGSRVKRGDVIGLMGSTGYSTGPHLHYEILKKGKAQNPLNYIIRANF